jgi:pimeloyl-ACP methyl ester carboxylesterase
MVHGLGGAGSFWDNLRDRAGRCFEVHTPDLPGHGPGATAPTPALAHPRELAGELVRRLRARGLERPHLVGLSLGGWVVLEMAALGYGASVLALAPAGLWEPGSRIRPASAQTVLRRGLVPVDRLLPRLTATALVGRVGLRSAVAHPDRVSATQLLGAARALGQATGYGVCDRAAIRHRFDAAAKVGVPVAVAFGDHDAVLPPTTSQNRALLPPHARVSTVADCGHAMTWDQPERCLELIAQSTAADTGAGAVGVPPAPVGEDRTGAR